jgi:hypothetical protein
VLNKIDLPQAEPERVAWRNRRYYRSGRFGHYSMQRQNLGSVLMTCWIILWTRFHPLKAGMRKTCRP